MSLKQSKNTVCCGSGLFAEWHSCFPTPRRAITAGRNYYTALYINSEKKKKTSAEENPESTGCVFGSDRLLWFEISLGSCRDPEQLSGAEEVSDTGEVLVSSFLPERSQISTEILFIETDILGSSRCVLCTCRNTSIAAAGPACFRF